MEKSYVIQVDEKPGRWLATEMTETGQNAEHALERAIPAAYMLNVKPDGTFWIMLSSLTSVTGTVREVNA